ncbi:hypothetical protein [Rhodanobacter sp. MP7CTX1]|uniref:hypothetical protein n=1 Tax=Rhodanobacter sp. MP7CTX1 TaxID=2723084 RepID=UPI0016127C66|nr:hypothetical protein [Rhodanobacter sp. MP7CTX1]MBB6187531.1 hypothetical protein [Rhodanobacter sp. MP7CTX1]
MDKTEVLNVWIPYRLQGIETMLWAYNQLYDLASPRRMEVFVNGTKILQGDASAILNPMLEVGFIYARSLLEFLGLAAKDGRLVERSGRFQDDITIEHFDVSGVHLKKVSPSSALDAYTGGPRERGEHALVAMFELANKGTAHLSSRFPDGYTNVDLEIACKGVRALVEDNLYAKLGMQIPEPPKQDSKRGASHG